MFSQASEYALRALTELARCEREKWVLTGELAELLDLPVHYLGKVLQNLARKGILESQRGRQGGFRLAAAPDEITVFDVVRELDDVRPDETLRRRRPDPRLRWRPVGGFILVLGGVVTLWPGTTVRAQGRESQAGYAAQLVGKSRA